jgi:single-strand DNA-binding protein
VSFIMRMESGYVVTVFLKGSVRSKREKARTKMYSKTILIGRLGRDPETRNTQGGHKLATFSMATDRNFKRGEEWERETTWHEVETWGRLAEYVALKARKGSLVMVEGRLKLDQWEDRNTGNKRSKMKLVGESVKFLEKTESSSSSGSYPQDSRQSGGGNYSRGDSRSQPKYGKQETVTQTDRPPSDYGVDPDTPPF